MSGQLVGEVNRAGRRLKTAGVPRLAARALSIVAECVRDNRLGPVPLEYLAGAMEGAGERTASRALAQLRDLGLVEMVRRGGGRGHSGRPAVYRLVDVDRWLADRGVPAPEVAAQSRAARDEGVELDEFGRHDGGDSIGSGGDSMPDPGGFPADSPATGGGSISAIGGSIGYSPAKSGRLSRHLGGDLPVPVRTPGGRARDVAAGPDEAENHPPPRPRTRPKAQTPGQLPLVASVRDQPDAAVLGDVVVAGSWCGRPDCRHPQPCGACGHARRQQLAVAHLEDLERAAAARQVVLDRAAERAAAAANCPRRCVDGYVGRTVCDHIVRRPVQTIGDWQLARSVAAASAARAAARKRGELAPLGRTASTATARAAS